MPIKLPPKTKHRTSCADSGGYACTCGADDYNSAIDACKLSLNQASQEVGLDEVYKCMPEKLSGHYILYDTKMEIAKAILKEYILVRRDNG